MEPAQTRTGSTDPGAKQKLRIDKFSDGGITCLKLAGTIDRYIARLEKAMDERLALRGKHRGFHEIETQRRADEIQSHRELMCQEFCRILEDRMFRVASEQGLHLAMKPICDPVTFVLHLSAATPEAERGLLNSLALGCKAEGADFTL